MASRYQYETSPKKIQPDKSKRAQKNKKTLKVLDDVPREKVHVSSSQKKKKINVTMTVIGLFILLLTISYRNSQINEKFNEVQVLKKELSAVQKENEQLKVSIENSLNLNTIEKLAKEKLGMQKLTKKQTIYISLPKKDYVEPANEEKIITQEYNKNWFEKIIGIIKGEN